MQQEDSNHPKNVAMKFLVSVLGMRKEGDFAHFEPFWAFPPPEGGGAGGGVFFCFFWGAGGRLKTFPARTGND